MVGTYLFESEKFVRFFNPRIDKWLDHFYLENGLILPNTEVAQATIKILNFNDVEAVIDRQILIQAGKYKILR